LYYLGRKQEYDDLHARVTQITATDAEPAPATQ
jgi:hypothetical protein